MGKDYPLNQVMRNKRVCILSGIYPPDTGGPATFAISFADFAARKGFYPENISYADKSMKREKIGNSQVRLISRRMNLIPRYVFTIVATLSAYLRGCKIIANGCFLEVYVASLIVRKKYVAKVPGDIVWERAVNSGLTELDILSFQDQKLPIRFRLFRWLYSSALKRATFVIAPSKLLCNLAETWGVPRESIVYIPNSIDTNFYSPKQGEDLFHAIAVNRLVSWKHVDQIILACARRNLSLAIVGDGPEGGKLKMLALQLGANVKFYGEVSQDEVADLLSKSEIYILNSTFEATAYSLLEARSCGLIAISNANTGAAEIISDQIDGYLIQNSDSSSLLDALDNYSSLSKREKMDMRNKAILSTRTLFDREINFRKILELVDYK